MEEQPVVASVRPRRGQGHDRPLSGRSNVTESAWPVRLWVDAGRLSETRMQSALRTLHLDPFREQHKTRSQLSRVAIWL